MEIGTIIRHLLTDTVTGTAVYALILLFAVDFVTGVFRALSNKPSTFDLAYVDVWARAKGSRLMIILVVLMAGAVAPSFAVLGLEINPLTAIGLGWAGSVGLTELNSIKDNFDTKVPDVLPDASS